MVQKAGQSVFAADRHPRSESGSDVLPWEDDVVHEVLPKVAFGFGQRTLPGSSTNPLVDVQLVQERERIVERLKQILVVLDHLAAHVDAKPLLVDVQLIAIEHVFEW